jgi:hypothetical protein
MVQGVFERSAGSVYVQASWEITLGSWKSTIPEGNDGVDGGVWVRNNRAPDGIRGHHPYVAN